MADKQDEQEYTLKPKKKGMSLAGKVGLTTLVAAGAGIVAWPYLPTDGLTTAIETSQSEEFQDPADGDGFGRITVQDTPAAPQTQVPVFDPGPIEDELEAQRRALEAQNASLANDVAALQAQLQGIANAAPDDSANQELAEALAAVQTQNADLIKQLQEDMENRMAAAELAAQTAMEEERQARLLEAEAAADREAAAAERAEAANAQQMQLTDLITQLQRENDALQTQVTTGMDEALRQQAERERLAAEQAAQRASLEARRAEAEALRDAQINSEGVIFDAGARSASPTADTGGGDPASSNQPQSPDAAARSFVSQGAQAAAVTTAEVIANPSNTILQGTILNATIENAIDSSLPGQLIAVVNYPVYSFDQSRVLIPQGARLFGSYSSDVSLGQRRILVGWTRLVTPDGQSVELAAFGADDQGRSGLTGDVNNRFGLRFGSAALLSIIGAAPAIAAASADSEISEEAAERIGENFANTTNTVIGQYASLPPIISVQPGAAITVIVDRDLEFY